MLIRFCKELSAIYDLAVYDGDVCLAADIGEGIGSPDDHVGIFSDLQTSHTVFYTQAPGGIDGDCLPGFMNIKTGVYGKTCAHGQISQGDHRGVRDDEHCLIARLS